MRLISLLPCFLVALLSPSVSGIKLIESNALNLCSENVDSGPQNFTATYFQVTFTPVNRTLSFSFDGVSSISGKVAAELVLDAYGYTALRKTLDPCEMKLNGLCPMNTGQIDVKDANLELPESVLSQIPGELIHTPFFAMMGILTSNPRDRLHCSGSGCVGSYLYQLD